MHIEQVVLAELEIVRKSNRNVRNGNTVMEMKNAFDGLISMLATAVVRTIVLECRSTEITQNETQRGKAV